MYLTKIQAFRIVHLLVINRLSYLIKNLKHNSKSHLHNLRNSFNILVGK